MDVFYLMMKLGDFTTKHVKVFSQIHDFYFLRANCVQMKKGSKPDRLKPLSVLLPLQDLNADALSAPRP
jgi:hypothetical protein